MSNLTDTNSTFKLCYLNFLNKHTVKASINSTEKMTQQQNSKWSRIQILEFAQSFGFFFFLPVRKYKHLTEEQGKKKAELEHIPKMVEFFQSFERIDRS